MMPEGRVCVGRDSSLSLGETVRVRVLDYSEKKENTLLFFHRPKLRSLTPALSQKEREPQRTPKLFRIRDRVIAFFVTRKKPG
jgi:hypothetical protein